MMRLNPLVKMALIVIGLVLMIVIAACAKGPGLSLSSDRFVYIQGSGVDLEITFESDVMEELRLTGETITSADFLIDDDRIIIRNTFLDQLALGEYALRLEAGEENVPFVVVINDRPVGTDQVIERFVGEPIIAYDIFSGVEDDLGQLELTINTATLDLLGQLDLDLATGVFSFVPATMFAGTYILPYTVTDAYEAISDQAEITVIYHPVNPLIADQFTYDMASFADLVIAFDPSGTGESTQSYEFQSISVNDQELSDVTAATETITIQRDVLEAIGYGEFAGVISTTGGSSPFLIDIFDSREISSSAPDGIYARGAFADIVYPVDLYDKTIDVVMIGEMMLEIGVDVMIANHTLIINSTFAETLANGSYVIRVNDTLELRLEIIELVIEGVLFEDLTVTYDGSPKTIICQNLPSGANTTYASEGPWINAGTYQISVTVTKNGYVPLELQATLVIEKAVYDMSAVTFTDLTVAQDGSPKSILIAGDLPAGVTVTYQGNDVIEAGTYVITATFDGDDNHHGPDPLTATLVILTPEETTLVIDADFRTIVFDSTNPVTPDVFVQVQSFGSDILGVSIDSLSPADYIVTATGVTLLSSYLQMLDIGVHEVIIRNAYDSIDTFDLVISGPLVETNHPDGQIVTKFTNETITNEPFRVVPLVGTITAITLESDVDPASGILSINLQNATFSFERAQGFWGTATFSYIATDTYGFQSDVITMEIIYKPLNPVIADQHDKTYDKAMGDDPLADIVYTIVDTYGLSFDKVMNHDITSLDYDYDNGFLTINASYLATLAFGTYVFDVMTDGGSDSITITVMDDLAPTSTTPDQVWTKPGGERPTFMVETYANPLLSVMIGEVGLASEIDYTFESGELILSLDLLESLAFGQTTITLSNGRGTTDLTLVVRSDRDPLIVPDELTYVKGTMTDLEIALLTYGNTPDGLYGASLTTADYTMTETAITISHQHLETLPNGSYAILVRTIGDGFTWETTLTLDISTIIIDPVIEGIIDTYDADIRNDLTYDVTLHAHALDSIFLDGEEVTAWTLANGILTLDHMIFNHVFTAGTLTFEALFTGLGGDVSISFDAETVYENALNRVINSGFETGDLYGWNVYDIWKNELGMQAFEDNRVTSGTYFASEGHSYHRDGAYNVGIVWDAEHGFASWDLSSERMGHLRSSDFILSGSGFISFKLGGGRNSSFAYVSVRRSGTNEEVARFANRHFNDTILASAQSETTITNAEAFMFQYYFDLSSIDGVTLGDSLYVMVTDAAGFDWSVLALDTFVTYYESPLAPVADEIAVNILPVIASETASNQIIGSYPFVGSLDGWTDVNGAFRLDGDGARSDVSGNQSTGVLRSAAFHINGDLQYLRFDWAGGLAYDKQIFITIKEVTTNIEVIRIVRRDQLASKQSNDFDNHMVDLSKLDPAKLYYLEIADNRTGGWGITHIRAMRLVDLAEWNSVVTPNPGDQAFLINGLVTDFTYVHESA